jgi:hypothetical protein
MYIWSRSFGREGLRSLNPTVIKRSTSQPFVANYFERTLHLTLVSPLNTLNYSFPPHEFSIMHGISYLVIVCLFTFLFFLIVH